MRKKTLNKQEKALPGYQAQWERRSAGKAEMDGRQSVQAEGHRRVVPSADSSKEAASRTGLQKKQQPPERRQLKAAATGRDTATNPVQQGSASPAAGTPVRKQPLQTSGAMHREYILPYTAKQQRNILAREIASGGKLPEGYRWHRTGDTAYATKNLASKPLAAATAAGQPAVFGIDPSEYVKHMQAIDAYNAAAGSTDRQKQLTADRDAALSALGEEAAQYAGKSPAEYYRSYENQAGNEATARVYMESYKAPFLQLKGSDAARHAEIMNRLRMSEAYGSLNPSDFFETGDTQLLQKMTDEQKNTYLSIAQRHGAGAANDYWDTIRKSGGHDQSAYALRDTAYRSFARERPGLSSILSIGTAPLGLAGTAYSFGQKLLGKEIDPYADPFLFGQATSAIRDQVGAEITKRYGNADGTDSFPSWLMRMGYNAAMSGADSLLAGKLGGTVFAGHQKGAALAASLMQGGSGAGGAIQDIKLRGGTDEQALMMGGLSILFETATEYLPMEQLLKTANLKDAASFRQLAVNAFKGGLAEAPGEGLSELLGGISDRLIMGELSKYEQKWRDYRAGGLSETAAKQQAVRDILWGVCEASFTGFLSGEGSNLIAGAGGYLHSPGNRQSAEQQAMPGAEVMPWMDMPGLPGMPEGVVLPEAEAGLPVEMVKPEADAGLPVEMVEPEAEAGLPEGMVELEQAANPSAPPLLTEAEGVTAGMEALHDGQIPEHTEGTATSDGMLPGQQEQQTDGATAVEPDGQPTDGQMPARHSTRRTLSESREAVDRSFRERAKPLADRTRELWQSIQRTRDPVTRTLKELAYEQLFRPIWEDAVNDQFYREHPHLRPDPEVENRKVQERLAQVPPVLLQAAYEMVRGREQETLALPDERSRNDVNRQVPEMTDRNAAEQAKELVDIPPLVEKQDNSTKTVDTSPNSDMIISDRQLGHKAGKHMQEWELNPSIADDREQYIEITKSIVENAQEIRRVQWLFDPKTGKRTVEVNCFILGNDVVLVKDNGEYITTMKNGTNNGKVKNGRRIDS